MLTKLTIQNFKRFEKAEILLDDSVIFVGPNNSGKTTALQALALWDLGAKKWLEKRVDSKSKATKRPGVTIGRSELSTIPIPEAGLLWKNRSLSKGSTKADGKKTTENIMIRLGLEGQDGSRKWSSELEFYFANDESIYCRPAKNAEGELSEVPSEIAQVKVAFLPPMSGLSDREYIKQPGEINDLVGQGRTADVLRNLCYRIWSDEDGNRLWSEIADHIYRLFHVAIKPPERRVNDQLVLHYMDGDAELDISCSGRGLQQTLLLLTHLYAHPGSIWLLDEPDAHLEFIRQGQTYDLVSRVAEQNKCQVIIATHSEKVLASAAEKHQVIAFIGAPHAIGGKTSQVVKALKDIPFDEYLQAEQLGWILYVEGDTDLAILQAFAERLGHPARIDLDAVFWMRIANQQRKAEDHFFGLREAVPGLGAFLLLDRQESPVPENSHLPRHLWSRNEIENYICQPATLIEYAKDLAVRDSEGPLFEQSMVGPYIEAMQEALEDLVGKKPLIDPSHSYWMNTKISDSLLIPLFAAFTQKLGIYNRMAKGDFHSLVPFVPSELIDQEIIEVLDKIHGVAQAHTRQA